MATEVRKELKERAEVIQEKLKDSNLLEEIDVHQQLPQLARNYLSVPKVKVDK